MMIPDFSEFLASIDVEEMGRRMGQVRPLEIIQFDANDLESAKAAAVLLYQRAVEDASKITLLQLEAYHEWIQKQLD